MFNIIVSLFIAGACAADWQPPVLPPDGVKAPDAGPVAAQPGQYRPFIPAVDRVAAVMLAPSDDIRDRRTKAMTNEDISNAILDTALQLSRLKVKALLVGGPGRSMDAAMAELKTRGADMDYVEILPKPSDYNYTNHVWFRDYGPLFLKNTVTGKWHTVTMDPGVRYSYGGFIDTGFIDDYLKRKFGITKIGSYEVTGNPLMGGNIVVDEQGRCLSAGERHPLFGPVINCKSVLTFPCKSPVCHMDEYVTVLKNNTVVTNKPEFVETLRGAGYNVLTVPENAELSFTNVLIANGNVLMMYTAEYEAQMRQARLAYESQGYNVVPVMAGGTGSQFGALHCLTKEIPAN